MTNEQLALLLDPRREKPGWWREAWAYNSGGEVEGMGEIFTGPDYHASDDACFRDWRPVLLAAGCQISDTEVLGVCVYRVGNVRDPISGHGKKGYRAATLAAVEELHTTKPELLREAIARAGEGK